ncbi:MAG: helix-turn-helix domain-containing protein [Thermodesulfovibrionales bacterium]|nr:helix-turn-helix domain-containing protein [Thermodesulfovibrionales bacterium]
MTRRPVVVLTEGEEKIYNTLSLEGESVFIYPLSQSDRIKKMDMDLLILDSGYNPVKGLMILKEIKNLRPEIPVVFLTEETSEEIVIKTFKAGAREFFKKPFDLNEFKKRLNELLTLKRRAREKRTAFPVTDVLKFLDKPIEDIPASIIKTIYFMNEHLGDKLSILDMAREAGFSRFHFCRIFRRYTGISPKKLLCLLRLERAKILLRDPDRTVSDVAAEVGFNDLSNFIRYFKKYAGYTPSAYKREILKTPSQ